MKFSEKLKRYWNRRDLLHKLYIVLFISFLLSMIFSSIDNAIFRTAGTVNFLIFILSLLAFIPIYLMYKFRGNKKKDSNKFHNYDNKDINIHKKKLSREELKEAAVKRKHKQEVISKPREREEINSSKKHNTFNIDDIPEKYEVYEDSSFFVQGVTYRFDACLKWAEGDNHKISFKREPNNEHDTNAIAIFGKSSTGRRKLGYVAADIADDLVYRDLDDKIKARLLSVRIEEAPFIEYEILVESKAYKKSMEDN